MKNYISKTLLIITSFVTTLFISVTNAFATDVEVTSEVTKEKTTYRWFFWPAWAFLGLVVLVATLMAFIYWKNVLGPKKRGRKI